jgi:hypothetical protein
MHALHCFQHTHTCRKRKPDKGETRIARETGAGRGGKIAKSGRETEAHALKKVEKRGLAEEKNSALTQ